MWTFLWCKSQRAALGQAAGVFLLLAGLLSVGQAAPNDLTRDEILRVARSFAEYEWTPSEGNVRNGKDAAGVEVHTPSIFPGQYPPEGHWTVNVKNTGVPYKWGGFDSLESFARGVTKGKAAGDLYTLEKRRLGDKAVSSEAVGVDCSGFISRCWKLTQKHGTSTLPGLCQLLASPRELKPGDIMNTSGGHVMLFVEWLDEARSRAKFYEAEPLSKVRASEYSITDLVAMGFKPWRYKKVRE